MKKVLLLVLLVMLIGIVCGLLLINKTPPLSPAVTLPDGTSVRIAATTYGTNHVVGNVMARFAAKWPPAFRDFLSDTVGLRIPPLYATATFTPELLVWVDVRTNNSGPTVPGGTYFSAHLGDGTNFVSGPEAGLASYPGMPLFYPLHFNAFPRRDRNITLNIFQRNSQGVASLCQTLSFTNPIVANYPQWQPESLPATKRTGDLEVTLRGFETGHNQNSSNTRRRDGSNAVRYGTDRRDGQNTSAVDIAFHPLQNTNEIWQIAGVDLSDATGNTVHNTGTSSSGNNSFAFTPGLWPGEAAWKVKLELKRTEGFDPGEILVFRNVPLGEINKTNTIAWTTNFNGVTVNLLNIFPQPPLTNNNWSSAQLSALHVTLSPIPAGSQFDLLRLVSDTGKTNTPSSWTSNGTSRDYSFDSIPLGTKTFDVFFVLQKTRTIEFTVKPSLPEEKPAEEK